MVLSKNNITNEWIIAPTLSYVFLVACRSAKGVNTLRFHSCMGATRSDACASPQAPSNLMYIHVHTQRLFQSLLVLRLNDDHLLPTSDLIPSTSSFSDVGPL